MKEGNPVGTERFLEALERRGRMFVAAARSAVASNRALCSWLLDPLGRWADTAYGDRAFDDAALGYVKYCLGVAKAQRLYEQAGRYTPEALSEIKSAVYEDDGYMVPYMWAAILIYPFWASMVNHIALYRDEFLRALPSGSRVLELACGHGVLSLLAAESRPDIAVEGIDISPPAIAVANRLLQASGHGSRVSFAAGDALRVQQDGPSHQYQGIISAMLAEHLEDPRPHFQVISHCLAPDGLVFFSTALESPQRDHVYEFNHESEPLKMAEEVGLRVTRLVCDAAMPMPGGRFLPRALAMILRRR